MESILLSNCALLDPVKGELREDHAVLIEGGRIKEVSDKPIRAASAREIDAHGRTVMPGLIDLHVHVHATQLNLASQAHLPNVLVTLRSVPILQGMLRRGFTTVRDAGGAGHAIKQAVESGLAEGPRLFVLKITAENLPRSLPPRDAVHVKNRFRAHLGFSTC